MMNFKIIGVFLSLTLMAGTSQELYDHTELQVKTHCNNKVGVEREQCLKTMNTKPYKEYEAERKDIIKES